MFGSEKVQEYNPVGKKISHDKERYEPKNILGDKARSCKNSLLIYLCPYFVSTSMRHVNDNGDKNICTNVANEKYLLLLFRVRRLCVVKGQARGHTTCSS